MTDLKTALKQVAKHFSHLPWTTDIPSAFEMLAEKLENSDLRSADPDRVMEELASADCTWYEKVRPSTPDAYVASLEAQADLNVSKINELQETVRQLRNDLFSLHEVTEDIALAAGELLIPVPVPGTDMSRVLIANVLMRRERDKAREELAEIKNPEPPPPRYVGE